MRDRAATVYAALDRPRLWRVTAVLSATLLCVLVWTCSRGSLTIIARRPTATSQLPAASRSWLPWCTRGTPREDRVRLAFCARVDGLVIAWTHGSGPRESHLALLSDFHLVIVKMPEGAATPAWGSEMVAIGPLFRASDGEREVQAFHVERS